MLGSIMELQVISSSPEKKQRTTRVITKARLLTIDKHMEMFRKNAEQKRADEETKAERKRENNKTN